MDVYLINSYRQPVSWKLKPANDFILKKIHQRLGLDCVKFAIVSGAPVQRSTVEFFMGLNVPIMDMYGMSENSGPQTISTISNWRLGSIGQCLEGTRVKIDKPDQNGEGEVSFKRINAESNDWSFLLCPWQMSYVSKH